MAHHVSLVDRYLAWHYRRKARGFRMVRRCLAGKRNIQVRTVYGTVFECDPGEYIGSMILRSGFYESEVIEALKPFFSTSAIVWDVGSNFGLHAITAASLCPGMVVQAFEPIASLRNQFARHVTMNDVRVRCAECALSNETGSFDIYIPPQGASGRATLRPEYAKGDWQRQAVITARADELIGSGAFAMPTAIKLDVEGAELQVLEGFGSLLGDQRLRAVVFEGAPGLGDVLATDPIKDRLVEAGFRLTQLRRREPTHHDLENYLATR